MIALMGGDVEPLVLYLTPPYTKLKWNENTIKCSERAGNTVPMFCSGPITSIPAWVWAVEM